GESSPALRRSQAVALGDVAGILLKVGDTSGGLAAAIRAREIFQELAEAEPDHAGYQRDLSVSHNKVADLFVARGDFAAALITYKDGRAIRMALAQKDPT